ncbi:MAG: hypothetical protein HY074_15005 [Deltaproteobacteria bacterium]|nr:hypothetical protein [Deltaproteobacteria bacterium]
MTIRASRFLFAAVFAASSLGAMGCNLTGGVDNAKGHDELVLDAQAKIDTGDCDAAVSILTGITPQDNRVLQMTGTAHLCRAGATVTVVEGALGNYNTASQNFTVVGVLANKLVPTVKNDTDDKIVAAVNAFSNMVQTDEKSVWLAYANIVRAAGLLAKASSDHVSVKRADVSVAGCIGTNCTPGAACTAVNLNDADANNLINALIAASAAVGSASSIGAAKDLATRLGASAAQTANGGRCTAVNNFLSI